MAERLIPVPTEPRQREVTVRCRSCGCTDTSTLRTGTIDVSQRVWGLLEGTTPLLRFGGCAAACRCHEEPPHVRPALVVTVHRPGPAWAGGGAA